MDHRGPSEIILVLLSNSSRVVRLGRYSRGEQSTEEQVAHFDPHQSQFVGQLDSASRTQVLFILQLTSRSRQAFDCLFDIAAFRSRR